MAYRAHRRAALLLEGQAHVADDRLDSSPSGGSRLDTWPGPTAEDLTTARVRLADPTRRSVPKRKLRLVRGPRLVVRRTGVFGSFFCVRDVLTEEPGDPGRAQLVVAPFQRPLCRHRRALRQPAPAARHRPAVHLLRRPMPTPQLGLSTEAPSADRYRLRRAYQSESRADKGRELVITARRRRSACR
jgi:hypothetical protein